MEQNMENEIDTGVICGLKELSLRYYIGEAILITIYTQYGNLI